MEIGVALKSFGIKIEDSQKSEYVIISVFGITELGREYETIENGIVEFDGSKPINLSKD